MAGKAGDEKPCSVCGRTMTWRRKWARNWDDWRPLMARCRSAARRLVASGRLEITQGGHVVDPSTARGPIRLRLPARS